MKQLILILGGSEMLMRGRAIKSSLDFPVQDCDIIFTGTKKQFKRYQNFVSTTLPEMKTRHYVSSHDRFTKIKNTKHHWEKYDMIYIASEGSLKSSIKKLFKIFGRTEGLILQNTFLEEKLKEKLISKLYAHEHVAWITSKFARAFELNLA